MKHDRCAFPQLADGRPSETDLLTEEDIVLALASRLDGRAGEHGRLAADLGVSQATVSNILTGGRQIGPKVAGALGLRRVVRFERVG